VEGGDIEEEKKGGDWRGLRGSNVYGCWDPRGSLEDGGTGRLFQKGRDPGDQGAGNPALSQSAGEGAIVDIVEPCFDIQNQGRDRETRPFQGFHVIEEG